MCLEWLGAAIVSACASKHILRMLSLLSAGGHVVRELAEYRSSADRFACNGLEDALSPVVAGMRIERRTCGQLCHL